MSEGQRVDIGAVLTGADGQRYLLIDIYPSGKVKLVRIPESMVAEDFGRRFFHDPSAINPTHSSLVTPA
jgi:hypothetical protein